MKSCVVLGCAVCVAFGLFATEAHPGPAAQDTDVEQIEITISPKALVLGPCGGPWVTVHTDIPYSAVQSSSLELGGVGVAWTKADSLGNLVAKFAEADIEAIVSPPSVTLEMTGQTKLGTLFAGSDTIRVLSSK